MNRRQLILGLGSVVGGSVGVVGSGAFSSISANRSVDLRVARDPNAYLGLNERNDGERSRIGDSQLRLRFPGLTESAPGDGPGSNSIYEFDDSGFIITNQGTQQISIYAEQAEESAPYIEIYDITDEDKQGLTESSPASLSTGGSVTVGIRIDTRGASSRTELYSRTLTIRANETE